MKTIHGKKGDVAGFSWLFLFWRFIITCFVAVAMVALVKMYIVAEINIQEIHAQLFINNIMNTKEGLSYYNPINDRVYPGTIAIDNFNDDLAVALDSNMDYHEQDIIAAELTLFTLDGKNLGTVVYNKEWYERWRVLADTSWSGKGGIKAFLENRTVLLIYPDRHNEPGILQFNIMIPNSY